MSANRPTPIWLAHHWPDEYDRCVLVGRRHICRRCIVMYPIAFAVIALSLAGVALPTPWSQLALVFLPLPALVEFVGEHLGSWRYSATRQSVLGALQGLGLGIGLGRYLDSPTDPWFWGVGLTYSAVAGISALVGARRRSAEN